MIISDNSKIILALDDYFDYEEYVIACVSKDIEPFNIGQFYQAAGLMEGARRRNHDDPEQGYLEIVREMNKAFRERKQALPHNVTPPETRKCGGCGGGKVR